VWRADLPLLVKLEAIAHLTSNYAYLLLFFLCVLMHPSLRGAEYSFWRLLVDLPIYLLTSLPATFFYVCAQRELHPKTWLKEIVLMPMVLALGVGLAINNARAVIEALVGHPSEFTRTPKYGIERRKQSWRGTRYIPMKSILPFVELSFALYFSSLLWDALVAQQWVTAAFLLLFQAGFSYVALCSLAQWLPQVRLFERGPDDALPA
ncbi:MAG: glycosyl transferase family 2, partial [Verrucomicrobiota bacterium]|nr:glycosyl transferase family 2 [Verrucomicrobiota bacterium]